MTGTSFRLAGAVSAGLAGTALSVALIMFAPTPVTSAGIDDKPAKPTTSQSEPRPYYTNCAQVERETNGPLMRGEPGYRTGLDKDGNGIACD